MTVEYEYTNKATAPSLSTIHDDVATSEMTDKNIVYCRWDEDTEILKVVWTDTLSAGDKTILDGIVTSAS